MRLDHEMATREREVRKQKMVDHETATRGKQKSAGRPRNGYHLRGGTEHSGGEAVCQRFYFLKLAVDGRLQNIRLDSAHLKPRRESGKWNEERRYPPTFPLVV
jgi:hypothetical protein